jgi:hypothetical protein
VITPDDLERVARSPFTIGAIGAAISSSPRFLPGATWLERLSNVAAGALTAGYLTPAVTTWVGLERGGMGDGAAFVIGAFGMSLMAALLQAIKETAFGQILTGWLSRRP